MKYAALKYSALKYSALKYKVLLFLALAGAQMMAAAAAEPEPVVSGRVTDSSGQPLAGVMVTLSWGEPERSVTVFSQTDGRYRSTALPVEGPYRLRARRIGWKEQRVSVEASVRDIKLVRETDAARVARQLPANHWYALVLDRVDSLAHRQRLLQSCVGCHQQGNPGTRAARGPEDWKRVLDLMAAMGGYVEPELRKQIPELFNSSYDPDYAIPRLTAAMKGPGFTSVPAPAALKSVIDEWVLGEPDSMQHDLAVHPDGRIYVVDWTRDMLYRLDPDIPGGDRAAFPIPDSGLPVGGVLGDASPLPPHAPAKVAPHSLQMDGAGNVWLTLSLSGQLARFDPADEKWDLFALKTGVYPHTLRFDQRGRIWYTIAFSDHVGFFDPATGDHRQIALTRSTDAEEKASVPVPYGIDVAPNGEVWFSQLLADRIGRIDPSTFKVELIDTPFSAPRRLRIDASGDLWIPGFASGLIARYRPATGKFTTWQLPERYDTPYALNVDPATGAIWICGSNSDTLIRFEPSRERFTSFPLPTRSSYTREIDFDREGRIWTSNSNFPARHIEGGMPRLMRLDLDPDRSPVVAKP